MFITNVGAREILDSRGFPTIEAWVEIGNTFRGYASVPAGASRGSHEAFELRDGGTRWMGKGVLKAIENIKSVIGPAIIGKEADIRLIDELLIELDGSRDKSRLGANAILAVSLAVVRAIAAMENIPLYRLISRISRIDRPVIPTPMVNMISGGHHANWNLDFQDFLIIPLRARTLSASIEEVVLVYHHLKNILRKKGLSTLLADEGGFSPIVKKHREALDLLVTAIEEVGFKPGEDIGLAIDAASTHLYYNGVYRIENEGLTLTNHEMVDYIQELCETYPIYSVEDACAEDDLDGWRDLYKRLGKRIQIVGDDLFTTSVDRLEIGVKMGLANSSLIKPNQVGTLTETIKAILYCKENGLTPIVSARSGDTEDSFIADLAVGSASPQIKIGSIARSERTAKYNRLLWIEEELSEKALYLGGKALHISGDPIF
jgi:enolase